MQEVREIDGYLVPNVERDSEGRMTRAFGKIDSTMLREGQRFSEQQRLRMRDGLLFDSIDRGGGDSDEIRDQLISRTPMLEFTDAGHIIPKSWGGGNHPDNCFPQNASVCGRWARAVFSRYKMGNFTNRSQVVRSQTKSMRGYAS